MKKIIFFLAALGFLVPGYSIAAIHDIHVTYDFQPIDNTPPSGYYLYQQGTKVCTDTTPTDGIMENCTFQSDDGTFSFTLTAFYNGGSESPHSPPYSFTLTTPVENDPPTQPVAVITPATFTGDAPLTVAFDASSTTNAVACTWDFGDGTTSNSPYVSHTYATAGVYIATLTVHNAQGQTDSVNTNITVNEVVTNNNPPVASIGSSTAMGSAPLSISFDGNSSYDPDGSIISFHWNFGDGSPTTTGASTSHRYTEAGTYSTTLTVTDNQGATNKTSTPVIITGQTAENQAPTARLTTSTTEGTIALEIVFNGTASTDPEDSPLNYQWNFGDGNSGQGATTTHIYTTPGSFNASLTVTDEHGATSNTGVTIYAVEEETPDFQIELGEVELDHNWIHVDFDTHFINPIVVAGPPSRNDSDPCVVRMRNITSSGFDIRIQEWNYLDGKHAKETVAYLVVEQGNFTLSDGTLVEAGKFTSDNTTFRTVEFKKTFNTQPVVMTSIASFNEEDTVTARMKNITTTSFDHRTQEQELGNEHGNETVNYIAWEPTQINIDNINVIVNKTGDEVKHRWYTVDYGAKLASLPLFFGTMQTQDGGDTSSVRYNTLTNSTIQVMVEEEKSKDSETRHTSETVGYFLFSEENTTSPDQNPLVEAETFASPTSVESLGSSSNNLKVASRFLPTSTYSLEQVDVALKRYGNPSYTITVKIYSSTEDGLKPATLLATGTNIIDALILTAELTDQTLPLDSPVDIAAGTYYWVVYEASSYDNNNVAQFGKSSISGGRFCTSADGINWSYSGSHYGYVKTYRRN